METAQNMEVEVVPLAQTLPSSADAMIENGAAPLQIFRARVAEWGPLPALRRKDRGIWRTVTWTQYGQRVRQAALALASLGCVRGDVVSVLAENGPEWLYADLGAQALGVIGNGIYPTSSPDQLRHILTDSQTRIIFVENQEQLDKVRAIRRDCPRLQEIVVFDLKGLRGLDDDGVMTFEAFLALGADTNHAAHAALDASIEAAKPEDIAFLVYTSGTTGAPKGAMIANRNLTYQLQSAPAWQPSERGLKTISFLPLCHIAERMASPFTQLSLGQIIHFPENTGTVVNDMREVAPHRVFAPPRFWEKLYAQVDLFMKDAIAPARFAYTTVTKTDTQPGYAARALHGTVTANVQKFLGLQHIQQALVGAAPVSPDLIRWYARLGIELQEAFGMTETSGACTVPRPGQARVGWAGQPLGGTEIKLGAEDELLIRGPNVFAGYWNAPEKTRDAFTPDGFFKTGDCADIDADGYLRIKDRIKDILITSGGKNITPSQIENALKVSPYLSDAMVVGDGRKYLTCLVMLDIDSVSNFAQDAQVPFTDFVSLTRAQEVNDLVRREIETANAKLARVEQVKDFRIISQLLTAEDEELTPTMKLKRRVVLAKYTELIDEMYRT
jgi:long-chain acyl-CoA synthetase